MYNLTKLYSVRTCVSNQLCQETLVLLITKIKKKEKKLKKIEKSKSYQ